MKIALCDDLPNDRISLKNLILELYPKAEIFPFGNGFVLLEFLEKNSRGIDGLIIDMKMPYLSGLDAAAEIKQLYPYLPIIAVTSYPGEYAVPAYDFSPVHFLVKPIGRNKLKAAFERVMKNLRPDAEMLAVQAKGLTRYLPLDTVYGIQAQGQGAKVKIITLNGEIETLKRLDSYEKELIGKGFFRIRKNSMVNLSYVREVAADSKKCEVMLQNGDTLPVAKRRRNDLFAALIKWRRVNA